MLRKYHLVPAGIVLTLFLFYAVSAINTVGEGYRSIPGGSALLIDAHGVCRQLTNSGSTTYFVPTRTSAEWGNFRNAVPGLPGLSFSNCCTETGWVDDGSRYCTANCGTWECGSAYGRWKQPQKITYRDCSVSTRIVDEGTCSIGCGYCYGMSCVNHYCEYVSCFVAGTIVTMADGSKKNIEDVRIGEILKSYSGSKNIAYEYDRPLIGGRSTYIINGEIEFTGEHPFLSTEGWKVANLDEFHAVPNMIGEEPTLFDVGDVLITDRGEVEIETFETVKVRPPDEMVYNFKLTGDGTYYANGYVVHNQR